jgi:hypothetical protein
MRNFLLLVLSCFFGIAKAQQIDSLRLIELNQQIDDLVVSADTMQLRYLYAPDFVFSHGSGRVDQRSSWLVSASKGSFIRRQHDSVRVELHPGTAILRGKLLVSKRQSNKIDQYFLWYIRVYALREKQWQLISHTTYAETHL